MKFKIGKYYEHMTGAVIHIIGSLNTTLYGMTLIAECANRDEIFMAIGPDSSATANWVEVDEEEWSSYFPK